MPRWLNWLLGRRVKQPRDRETKRVVLDIAEENDARAARVRTLREEFKRLDMQTKDGFLTERDAQGELPPGVFAAILRQADLDGDGRISVWEYVLLHLHSDGVEDATKHILDARCRRVFRLHDADWDGKLDTTQVRAAVKDSGAALDDEDVLDRCYRLDRDRDMKLTLEEFVLLMKM